jgi:hypothetical protein
MATSTVQTWSFATKLTVLVAGVIAAIIAVLLLAAR